MKCRSGSSVDFCLAVENGIDVSSNLNFASGLLKNLGHFRRKRNVLNAGVSSFSSVASHSTKYFKNVYQQRHHKIWITSHHVPCPSTSGNSTGLTATPSTSPTQTAATAASSSPTRKAPSVSGWKRAAYLGSAVTRSAS